MKLFLSILILLFLYSCNVGNKNNEANKDRLELVPEPDKELRLEYERNEKFYKMETDSLWNYLAKQGGCLTGNQYSLFVENSGEDCVMVESEIWDIFFKRDKKELTDFLFSKMADTMESSIHTCPFDVATNGELAVYCLQKIHGKNWFDFNDFNEFANKQSISDTENYQIWLRDLLNNKKKRKTLKELYLNKMEK